MILLRLCAVLACAALALGCPGVEPSGLTEPPGDPPPLPADDDDGDDDDGDDDDTAQDDDDTGQDDDDTGADDDDDTGTPDFVARGVWATRWDYGSAADVTTIFDRAEAGGFNQVYFQVRGNADAYYESSVEPWARGLSGTLGQDPGWDPLQTAIDEGAARGIEVHAWLNTFNAWTGEVLPAESTPRHALLDHPDWLVVDDDGDPIELNSSYVFFSPGIEGVRAHVAEVAGDLVDRYAVDGVHLDYVRYPGPQYSYDAETQAALDGGADRAEHQRLMVLDTVSRVRDAIDASRPGTMLTGAVWGIYEDLWSWGTSQGNIDYFQDSLAMIDDDLMDAIIPMIYWPVTNPPGQYTDYRTLIEFFAAQVPGDRLWAGMKADYSSFDEIEAEIAVAREAGATGHVVFAWATIEANGWWDEFSGVW